MLDDGTWQIQQNLRQLHLRMTMKAMKSAKLGPGEAHVHPDDDAQIMHCSALLGQGSEACASQHHVLNSTFSLILYQMCSNKSRQTTTQVGVELL